MTLSYDVRVKAVAIRESGSALLATYEYDQLGRRDRLVLGNGAVTDYQYDGASRLSKLTHDLAGTGHDNEVGFAYNPAGQIVRREASNTAYAWTNHFNASTSQSFDGLNRPIGDAHDLRSNRATDGIRTDAYDSENKGRGVPAAPWHYDPLGRLSGASTSPGTPPAIAYESYVDNLVAERTPGSSTVQRRHVFGPGVDEPIVWYEGSSRRFLQADERGSIVAVTSDTGALLAINRYDEYGQTESTSNAHMGRFLYTGQRYFGGFGLYHYKNRVYDPRVGRFMQPDPIGYEGGMNLYSYVGADPVNFRDPSGLAPMDHCTGTRLCSNHDGSGGGISGSVQVFADVRGFSSGSRGVPGTSAKAGTTAAADSEGTPTGPGWWRRTWSEYGIPSDWVYMGSVTDWPAQAGATSNDGGEGLDLACVGAGRIIRFVVGDACGKALADAWMKLIPKPATPSLPAGVSPAEMGRLAGWGSGQVSRNFTSAQIRAGTQNLRNAGFTRDHILAWHRFYDLTHLRQPGNIAAATRARFLRQVANGW